MTCKPNIENITYFQQAIQQASIYCILKMLENARSPIMFMIYFSHIDETGVSLGRYDIHCDLNNKKLSTYLCFD